MQAAKTKGIKMIKPLTSDGGMHPNIHDCMDKINELVDTINKMQTMFDAYTTRFRQLDAETRQEIVRPPYMQNKRLRKALSIAQSALVKLANDAYDFDEHIYIDKILNQIERITKGGDNE